jgi:hypothetical protein
MAFSAGGRHRPPALFVTRFSLLIVVVVVVDLVGVLEKREVMGKEAGGLVY